MSGAGVLHVINWVFVVISRGILLGGAHPDTQAIFTLVASFNALTKSDTNPGHSLQIAIPEHTTYYFRFECSHRSHTEWNGYSFTVFFRWTRFLLNWVASSTSKRHGFIQGHAVTARVGERLWKALNVEDGGARVKKLKKALFVQTQSTFCGAYTILLDGHIVIRPNIGQLSGHVFLSRNTGNHVIE
jgi:hypothetical protein